MRSSSPRSIAGVKIIQRWDRWTKFRSIHTSRDVPGRSSSVGPGQKRGVFGAIKRELRRRSAIEPVIGHMKAEGHLGRCYLKGGAGDAANAILSAVGYNFRRILAWLRDLLCQILFAILRLLISQSALNPAS